MRADGKDLALLKFGGKEGRSPRNEEQDQRRETRNNVRIGWRTMDNNVSAGRQVRRLETVGLAF